MAIIETTYDNIEQALKDAQYVNIGPASENEHLFTCPRYTKSEIKEDKNGKIRK